MIDLPVGTILLVEKNGLKNKAAIVGYYPFRKHKYALIDVVLDKDGKYSAIQKKTFDQVSKEGIYSTDGSNFVELDNIWPLTKNQVESLVNSCGVDAQRFVKMMHDEINQHNKGSQNA
jgi:hypothetical protein